MLFLSSNSCVSPHFIPCWSSTSPCSHDKRQDSGRWTGRLSLSKTCLDQAPNSWVPKAQTDLTGKISVLKRTRRRSGQQQEHLELCPTMPRRHRLNQCSQWERVERTDGAGCYSTHPNSMARSLSTCFLLPTVPSKTSPAHLAGLVQPEEEKAVRGPNIYLQISEGWVSGGWGQALFTGAQ